MSSKLSTRVPSVGVDPPPKTFHVGIRDGRGVCHPTWNRPTRHWEALVSTCRSNPKLSRNVIAPSTVPLRRTKFLMPFIGRTTPGGPMHPTKSSAGAECRETGKSPWPRGVATLNRGECPFRRSATPTDGICPATRLGGGNQRTHVSGRISVPSLPGIRLLLMPSGS